MTFAALAIAASHGDDVALTVLDDAARERGMRVVDLLTADVETYVIGNGYGYGYGNGNGNGSGNDYGYGYGYGNGYGYGTGDGYGYGDGGGYGDGTGNGDGNGKSISIAGRKP